jgi:hypothetical protein
MRVRSVISVGLGGAVAGALNAWLCYARVPVAVEGDPTFGWHLIPAGAIHGAVLAGLAWSLGVLLAERPLGRRLVTALPLAWLAGFVSWIPLNRSAFDESWATSLTWPVHDGWGATLLGPLQYFGLVALAYYLAVTLWLARERRLQTQLPLAVAAGVLGSLWWWIEVQPWYFSVLHGAIWGAFVDIGAWAGQRDSGVAR